MMLGGTDKKRFTFRVKTQRNTTLKVSDINGTSCIE